ncbi:glycosyltransferase [Pseudomonas entomophila]|uniref:glycosyltransferase n=1 Tax=Pseudomonas entomophila TaxID=312306 RepID=UPI0023D81B52|nr:glycosyltransferase [Pseudomonas entomophila]MDF0729866.1 glycosyltransferase [Pseudomonas entomophila]
MLNNRPRVAVLLAAYNGMEYISEQVDSILQQEHVDVDIYVSVDLCADGTQLWVQALSEQDPRVKLLPYGTSSGGAGKNFYRLIADVDYSKHDYVAFSDQDDIWLLGKLARGHHVISQGKYVAYSCNMMAFWPNGTELKVSKSQTQVAHDYIFESGGAGCTYILSVPCALQMKAFLSANRDAVHHIDSHDWLIYAWYRASGLPWFIDDQWWIRYRQHDANLVGANRGVRALARRLSRVRDGWYRKEVGQIARLVDPTGRVSRLASSGRWCVRLGLVPHINQLRRSRLERLILLAFIIMGIF